MADLDEFALAKLAREMAMNIRPYQAVFDDFGITEEEYYEILKIDFYRRAKEQFALEWNSALSVNERVKLISASYVEETLPVIGRRMLRETEPFASVIDAGKYLARNAGLGEPKTAANTSERFVITINLGADTVEHYDKSIAIDANDISPTPDTKVKALPLKKDKEEIEKDKALSAEIKTNIKAFELFTKDD